MVCADKIFCRKKDKNFAQNFPTDIPPIVCVSASLVCGTLRAITFPSKLPNPKKRFDFPELTNFVLASKISANPVLTEPYFPIMGGEKLD